MASHIEQSSKCLHHLAPIQKCWSGISLQQMCDKLKKISKTLRMFYNSWNFNINEFTFLAWRIDFFIKMALKILIIVKIEKILHFFPPTLPIKIKLGLQIDRGY
jgi:hypothetical protein